MNPVVFLKTARVGLEELWNNPAQPVHLGNYSKRFSPGEQKTIIQSIWGKYLNHLFLPIYISGFFMVIFFIRKKWKYKTSLSRLKILLISLVLWIPLLYAAIFVAGGINDFVKHNLPVYYLISIMFLVFWIFILNNAEKAVITAKSSEV